MAGMYPHRPSEQYEFPTTMVGVLEDEMRFYRSGPELRLALTGLKQAYGRNQLVVDFQRFALVMHMAVHGVQSLHVDEDFYNGTVMATHATLTPAPHSFATAMLGTPIYNEDVEPEKIRRSLEDFADFRHSGMYEIMGKLDDQTAETILEIADRTYEDLPGGYRLEGYIGGMIYASTIIMSAMQGARISH